MNLYLVKLLNDSEVFYVVAPDPTTACDTVIKTKKANQCCYAKEQLERIEQIACEGFYSRPHPLLITKT